MTVKTVITGAGGRMGRTLIRLLVEEKVPGLALAGAVDIPDCPALGQDAGTQAGTQAAGIPVVSDLETAAKGADILIDFTHHTATVENARRCADWGTAMVIGTTGLSEDEMATIAGCAKTTPIVVAPNMSLGMNLLFCLVTEAARALKDKGYDIEIIERHHRLKKDAPSGTAIGLGQAAAKGLAWDLTKVAKHGREGLIGERPAKEIGFHAVRGGDIVGDHTVLFAADGECVELSHRATSRETFALGALQAATWLPGKPAGLYSMRDVLGLVE
ncbi:MAG: 4-hydroxy-tetrahydrodipicolinate reductase [Spartobacteria bacterium]|nr:4-hydroxy-tetrahydrodipicolinate reductase [Spartobacteria bacterium]